MNALIGAMGALAYEGLKLFTVWEAQGDDALRERLADKGYLAALFVLVLCSGFFAWAMVPHLSGGVDMEYWAAGFGAGARPILATIIQSIASLFSVATKGTNGSKKPDDAKDAELKLSPSGQQKNRRQRLKKTIMLL